MTPDNEQGFAPLKPLQQVESLGHIGERVARKKEQENKRRKKRRHQPQLDEELADDAENEQSAISDDHVDFRA